MKKYITIRQLEFWGFEIKPDTKVFKLVAGQGYKLAGYAMVKQDDDLLINLSNDTYDTTLSKEDTYLLCEIKPII